MPLTGLAALAQVVGVTIVTAGAILIHGAHNDKKEKNTTNTKNKEKQ